MEREEDVQTEESNVFIEEKSKSDYPSSTQEQENKTPYITPEIYNVNTNIEVINKQKSQFELLKHEVDNLKTRSLRVEYEKKLIEATIDFPDNVYFNTLLGDHYIENNDFKKAQTIYKKLHLQDEFDDKALYKLGVINLELGDVQAAEYLLNKAKELKPENPKYYQVLAEIKYNLEKIDECIELMEKAVDLRPTKFDYIEILGKLYKETDNIQLYYKTLLKMNALEPLNQRVR
jgi:predicted Zn-dependent protease